MKQINNKIVKIISNFVINGCTKLIKSRKPQYCHVKNANFCVTFTAMNEGDG